MKKNELKASLGKIRPREELVSATLNAVREQKERQERRFVLPSYSFGMRLAGAVCAFALVFCIGFIAARQNINTPDARTLAQLEHTEATSDSVSMFAFENEYENGYILINGNVDSMTFIELAESDKENGALRRCKVSVNANGLIEKSDNLIVDLNKSSAVFDAEIVFYDNEVMNMFFDQTTGEMFIRLTPDENGNWSIVEFAPFEK